ncbi:P-loop containing nucleoside triphosphate hydrolase protein [Gamsiella multidivaricata]|uniref:P-loop containing nucleoside triphosphate hydrolase protein n=1 Tax=Gamsiella multidivaricata TaxID=101098 RepID=UPI00221FA98D|nr:P-loop containing nucleoside triphosphate hydrolase protein [Gamsiella multidivaricata]KAI7817098.1 P-loop containing nucleoside triphosphate hydrolase protein [Gamsiella multidivaricata]
MLNVTPRPKRASELCLERNSRQLPFYLTTGSECVDHLLGGHGWVSGEVSEICGSSSAGKTQMCLNTLVAMLARDKGSRAIWIDTLDGGFSAQRASDVIRTYNSRQKGPLDDGQFEGETPIEVYSCRDVYDVVNAIETIHADLEQGPSVSDSTTRLVIIDSLTKVLTGLLRGVDGVGHATMIHTARELRRLASDFGLVLLVTTSTVHVSYPEEQTPSILMANNAKPSLGSTWRYATDLQLYITRMSRSSDQQSVESLVKNENGGGNNDEGAEQDASGNNGPSRLAEIMKSKHLKIGEWCLFDLAL